ncbi:MAG: GNAT family N-acetyltransferase [Niabella sp.]|nr:GNAT family N-acetyltransferase [Niabella sp.]
MIRKAEIADLEKLQAFARSTFADTYGQYNTAANMQHYHDEVFSAVNFKKDLQSAFVLYYLIEEKENIAGYIKLNLSPEQTDLNDPDSLELERIYIAAMAKGRGLGKRLLQTAAEVALELQKDYLWLGVWEQNETAIRFYQKNGFVPFDTHVFMLGADSQKDILMKKILN